MAAHLQAVEKNALIEAVQKGDENQVQKLLAAGADKDAQDEDGDTAFHLIAMNNENDSSRVERNRHILTTLMRHQARPDVRKQLRSAPLTCRSIF